MAIATNNHVVNYFEMETFQGIYLEDSYVLDLAIGLKETFIIVEMVLKETHPKFHLLVPGEQYCYHKGKIIFSGYSEAKLSNIDSIASIDKSGDKDFGNIDALRQLGSQFELWGNWGVLNIVRGTLRVELESR